MKRLLMLAAAAALMSACGFSKPSTFYVLDDGTVPEQSVVSTDANRILIGIEPVFMPNYLDKPQIVIRQADDVTLTASEFNRWAEQPADVFPRVLANAISARAGYPAAKQINMNRDLFPYRLYVEVLRFDASFDGRAVLDAWWTVMTDSGKLMRRARTTLSVPAGKTYADVVAAERKLLNDFGAVIADYAVKNLAKAGK